jgi:hypothetical protein
MNGDKKIKDLGFITSRELKITGLYGGHKKYDCSEYRTEKT